MGVMTLAMTRCGTPFWTAPEIVQGATYNEKVDQYAYGMLLLEILTGRPPWHSEAPKGQQLAPLKVMQMVVSGRRPPMPPDTPPPLADLIQACWAAEPAERPSFKAVV